MKTKLRVLLSNPFTLLVLLMLIIVGIDQLLGHFHVYYAANSPLYDGALSPEAALNALWYELWFAETIAVIVLPLVLVLLRKKLPIKAKLLPWCIAALVMLVGVASTGKTFYNESKDNGYIQHEPAYISMIVHQGAFYQPIYDQYDPSLESMLPTILKRQAWVTGGYAISALGLWIYDSKKIKKRQIS